MDQLSPDDRLSRIETCWNVLKQAHGGSTQKRAVARAWFAERYEGLVRRYLLKAVGQEGAEDLTQEFAVRFMEGRFQNVDPGRGRFRDYLKTCLFKLVADFRQQQIRQSAQSLPEKGLEPSDHRAAEQAPDHDWEERWRQELIERTMTVLRHEERRKERFLYAALKFRLDHPELRSEQAAPLFSAEIGKDVSAVWFRKRLKAARDRFAELMLEEVARTLSSPSPDAIAEELAELRLLDYCRSALERLRG